MTRSWSINSISTLRKYYAGAMDDPITAQESWVSADIIDQEAGIDILTRGRAVFYIVGTAHVSKQSCLDVSRVIRRVQPDACFLELCPERAHLLNSRPPTSLEKNSTATNGAAPLGNVVSQVRRGKMTVFQGLYGWLLGKVADDLEVEPGSEFRVAAHETQQMTTHVDLILGDRLLSITLARVWDSLSLVEKIKITLHLVWTGLSIDTDNLESKIEEMRETDVFTEAVKELSRTYQGIMRPLLNERDEYMAFMLKDLEHRGYTRIVAVLGAGHLPGIRASWDTDIDIDRIRELCTLPSRSKRSYRRVLFYTGMVAGVAAVTVGMYRSRMILLPQR